MPPTRPHPSCQWVAPASLERGLPFLPPTVKPLCLPFEGLPLLSASPRNWYGEGAFLANAVVLPVLLLPCPPRTPHPLRMQRSSFPLGKPASASILLGATHLFNEVFGLSCSTLSPRNQYRGALHVHRGRTTTTPALLTVQPPHVSWRSLGFRKSSRRAPDKIQALLHRLLPVQVIFGPVVGND